jgi:hypothetical protein
MAVTEVGPRAAADSTATPWTETTRLLCAAAYTEPTFAQEVVEDLLEEDIRAVDVPPAVDPAPVLKHCLAAVGRKRRRDRTLAAILAFFMLYAVIIGGVESLASALAFGGLAYLAARGPRRPTRLKRLMRWLLAAYLLFGLAALLISGLIWPGNSVIALGVVLAWATIAHDLWHGTYQVATKTLNRRAFDPDVAPAVADPDLVRRTEEIVERQAGNLTVYSGFLPFSSAGVDLGGWSFVIDLRKGREEMGHRVRPTPVGPLELYRAVERALRALEMSKLTIADRAYVTGTDVRDDADLLPVPTARPSTSVSAAGGHVP